MFVIRNLRLQTGHHTGLISANSTLVITQGFISTRFWFVPTRFCVPVRFLPIRFGTTIHVWVWFDSCRMLFLGPPMGPSASIYNGSTSSKSIQFLMCSGSDSWLDLLPSCRSNNWGLGAADAVDMRTILGELDAKHAQSNEGADGAAWQASTWPREFTKPLEWMALKHQPSLWIAVDGIVSLFLCVCVDLCLQRVCWCLPRVWRVPLHTLIYQYFGILWYSEYSVICLLFQESFAGFMPSVQTFGSALGCTFPANANGT